ncbi:MAG TPA: dihydrofolate reductase family protein [Cellulomonas sp.]
MNDAAVLEVLAPAGLAGTALTPDDEAGLLGLFDDPAPRPSTGAHVRAIMLASLDGAATGPDGRSGSLGNSADRRVFAALRALADVVLVGAGTVRAEGYDDVQVPLRLRGLRAARGRAPRVELAVVTGSGEVPDAVLDAGALVVTSSTAPALARLRGRVAADRLLVADGPRGAVDLPDALRQLAARGLVRVHAEGGPSLLHELLAAGVVDELCLTHVPQLAGGPGPRLLGPPAPARLELIHLLRAGSTLLGRWRVA